MEQDRLERVPDRDREDKKEEARESAVDEGEEPALDRQVSASVLNAKRAHPTSPAHPAYSRSVRNAAAQWYGHGRRHPGSQRVATFVATLRFRQYG
jgi:hypothetical protein